MSSPVDPSNERTLHEKINQARTAMVVNRDGADAELDLGQAFLLYAAFSGDLERTAHAIGITSVQLLRIVDEEGWLEKLKPIMELKKSSRPGDIERGLNRAENFVQAYRFKIFLERVMRELINKPHDELVDYFTTRELEKAPGREVVVIRFSARMLADFASAMEKAHALTYMSLNDTAHERTKRKDTDDGAGIGQLHVQLAEAMAKVSSSQTPRALLARTQIEVVEKKRIAETSLDG